jgi:hypothetical protein
LFDYYSRIYQRTPTVTYLLFLPDSVPTHRVSHRHQGFVAQATVEVVLSEPIVEVTATATAPYSGGGPTRDGSHDAGVSGVITGATICGKIIVLAVHVTGLDPEEAKGADSPSTPPDELNITPQCNTISVGH